MNFVDEIKNSDEDSDLFCVYCRSIAECRDHVIPVVYMYLTRNYDPSKSWVVPCCNHCNQLAGGSVAFSIPEKAKLIIKKMYKKYGKILRYPSWTQDELNELSYNLRNAVWGGIVAKKTLLEKIKNLEKTASLPPDYRRPQFVEEAIKELIEIMKKQIKKKKKSHKKTAINSALMGK